jgi:hypothetical protein
MVVTPSNDGGSAQVYVTIDVQDVREPDISISHISTENGEHSVRGGGRLSLSARVHRICSNSSSCRLHPLLARALRELLDAQARAESAQKRCVVDGGGRPAGGALVGLNCTGVLPRLRFVVEPARFAGETWRDVGGDACAAGSAEAARPARRRRGGARQAGSLGSCGWRR